MLCTDGQYIQGEKSKGYKFTERYSNVPLVRYNYPAFQQGITIEPIQAEIYSEENRDFISNTIIDYTYLSYWYSTKELHIDNETASSYAYSVMQQKFNQGRLSWDVNKDKSHGNVVIRKFPLTQYHAALYNINCIAIGDYKVSIDSNVHRLHSAITNIQRDYRNFLTYNGRHLANIDIANSQPYLLCLLLNPLFWDKLSNLSLNIGMLPSNIQERFSEEQISNIVSYLYSLNLEKVQNYITKASRGELYNYMVDVINLNNTSKPLDRDTIKTMMLIVFFSSNRFFQQSDAKLKRIFDQHFPAIYELIKLTKSHHKADLACLLQSIESEIILHRCCERIWEEGNHQVPIFTIHDSIATTIEHVEYVKAAMREELSNAVGLIPTLSIEYWNLSQIKYPNMLPRT